MSPWVLGEYEQTGPNDADERRQRQRQDKGVGRSPGGIFRKRIKCF